MPIILTARELAERLGASPQDVLMWRRLGDIPSFKVGGRIYFDFGKVIGALRDLQRAEVAEVAEGVSCPA